MCDPRDRSDTQPPLTRTLRAVTRRRRGDDLGRVTWRPLQEASALGSLDSHLTSCATPQAPFKPLGRRQDTNAGEKKTFYFQVKASKVVGGPCFRVLASQMRFSGLCGLIQGSSSAHPFTQRSVRPSVRPLPVHLAVHPPSPPAEIRWVSTGRSWESSRPEAFEGLLPADISPDSVHRGSSSLLPGRGHVTRMLLLVTGQKGSVPSSKAAEKDPSCSLFQ